MRYFFAFTIFFCLAFPVFSQAGSNVQRFRALSDNMATTSSRSNTRLAEYDSLILDDGSMRVYMNYRKKFDSLSQEIRDSESRLNLMLRTNDRISHMKEERNHYEVLISELDALKTEYDGWMRTVQ